MSSSRPAFRFRLDLQSGVPVYRQIIDQVRGGIASGALSVGDQLPTVRQLAVDLSINPNTVVRAYRELELGGLLETHQGTGTFISAQKIRGERSRTSTAAGADCFRMCGSRGGRRLYRGRPTRTVAGVGCGTSPQEMTSCQESELLKSTELQLRSASCVRLRARLSVRVCISPRPLLLARS